MSWIFTKKIGNMITHSNEKIGDFFKKMTLFPYPTIPNGRKAPFIPLAAVIKSGTISATNQIKIFIKI